MVKSYPAPCAQICMHLGGQTHTHTHTSTAEEQAKRRSARNPMLARPYRPCNNSITMMEYGGRGRKAGSKSGGRSGYWRLEKRLGQGLR